MALSRFPPNFLAKEMPGSSIPGATECELEEYHLTFLGPVHVPKRFSVQETCAAHLAGVPLSVPLQHAPSAGALQLWTNRNLEQNTLLEII